MKSQLVALGLLSEDEDATVVGRFRVEGSGLIGFRVYDLGLCVIGFRVDQGLGPMGLISFVLRLQAVYVGSGAEGL